MAENSPLEAPVSIAELDQLESEGVQPDGVLIWRMARTIRNLSAAIAAYEVEQTTPDLDELGEVIWNASRADEGTISATGARIVAAAVLAHLGKGETR